MSAPLLEVVGINVVSFWAFGNALQLLPDKERISSVAVPGLIQVCKTFCIGPFLTSSKSVHFCSKYLST